MRIYFSPAYNDTSIEFETFRKAIAIAKSLDIRPITGVELVEPEPVSVDELCRVHDPVYVYAVINGEPHDLATSNTLGWDETLFDAVCASSGGLRDAALWALAKKTNAGTLTSGVHHAGPASGSGYCTFNGLAIAATAALDAGARRVLIIDFDAHCGGGTAACIKGIDGIEQIDVSVNGFDRYAPRPDAQLVITDGEHYLDVCESALNSVEDPGSIDLVLYNAGMDPHRLAGGSRHIDTPTIVAREQLVFSWTRSHDLPVAWTLAGGYTVGTDMEGLVDLHRITIATAADAAGAS
jgi:acetoin utilization deacetylase AcuC-like enzyme